MSLFKLTVFVSLTMLLNATFSVIQFRKFLQNTQSDEPIVLPADVLIEVYLALAIAVVGIVFNETRNLKKIRLQAVQQEQHKTYEKTTNVNRSSSLRNLQRNRSGSIFSSGISKVFPSAKTVIADNSALQSVVQKAF